MQKRQNTLIKEMNTYLDFSKPFIDAYKEFRSIRHDYANYVQILQLQMEQQDLSRKVEMKKSIREMVRKLLKEIEMLRERPFYEGVAIEQLSYYKWYPTQYKFLWKQWTYQKQYFESLYHDMEGMSKCLDLLLDSLERSLDPEDWEIEEMLSSCDSFQTHLLIDDTLIASAIYTYKISYNALGMEFQEQLAWPEIFKEKQLIALYLLGSVLDFGLEHCPSKAMDMDSKERYIKVRSRSKVGVWHFQIDCPYTDHMVRDLGILEKKLRILCRMNQLIFKWQIAERRCAIDIIG